MKSLAVSHSFVCNHQFSVSSLACKVLNTGKGSVNVEVKTTLLYIFGKILLHHPITNQRRI